MLNCVEMCNVSPHFHAVQHYFCVGFTSNMPHTKGTVLLVCFQWVDTLASKHAKGMSLRYDVIWAQWRNTGGTETKT